MALKYLYTRRCQFIFSKTLSISSQSSHRLLNQQKGKLIYEKEKKLGTFFLQRYVEYLRNYDVVLERRFPKAMLLYKTFTFGIKDFYRDIKEYIKIQKVINSPSSLGLKALTRREMELYNQIPKDIIKVAPVLIISALPFSNYLVFPLAFMFPKHLLTSHFWSLEQRQQFKVEFLHKRLVHSQILFNHMQEQTPFIFKGQLYVKFARLLEKIRLNNDIAADDVLAIKQLFMERPFHIIYLRRKHLKLLLKLHDLRTGFFKRIRLEEHAAVLKAMDYAILMEGGVHNLPVEALKNACFLRGLNPVDVPTDKLVIWMNKWLTISRVVDMHSYSLILHAPMFIGLNERSNVKLIEEFSKISK